MKKTFEGLLEEAFAAGVSHQLSIDLANRPDAKPWDAYTMSDEEAFQGFKDEWAAFGELS